MLMRNKIAILKVTIANVFALFLIGNSYATPIDQSISIEKEIIKSSSNSQNKIDRFAEQTQELSFEYKSTLRIIEQLQNYNTQLELLIESQEKEMVSIQNQMETIETTKRGVIPLMNEMIVSLDKFIQLDLPFQKEKREKKVSELKNMMIRADVSESDKYRRILETYQNEISYGETYGTYQGNINDNGVETKVDFLQAGRVALLYLTLDGQKAGIFNMASNKFEPLADEYIRGIELALKIVNKQTAPELTKLPVPAAQGAN